MNVQSIGPVESWQTYLDRAFLGAKKMVAALPKRGSKENRIRTAELKRVKHMETSLVNAFDRIVRKFPRVDELNDFYQELVRCTMNYDEYKQSLGAVNWAKNHIQILSRENQQKMRGARSTDAVLRYRTAFSGRVSATVKKIRKSLEYLDEARKTMRRFPDIKEMDSVVIAGVPNVGKSTLLAALTGSKPEIAHYPFTTKHLNVAIDKRDKIQYIDTPGLLDRPLSKRNLIEQHAIIALRNVAQVVLFVFDPSEACGYPVHEQKNLLADIKKVIQLPVVSISNKVDASDALPDTLPVSAMKQKGIRELKTAIRDHVQKV